MFARIGKRVTFANVMLTVALVFAMSGGAYAAKKYLITSTKQISPKVLSALKGKAGLTGAPGARGETGPQGPQGVKGETGVGQAGKDGKDGLNGPTGPTGPMGPTGAKGATGASGPSGATGAKGDAGASGSTGPQGEPWTAGGVLPAGKEERGAWNGAFLKEGEKRLDAISFGIPLKSVPSGAEFVPGAPTVHCPGSAKEPTAKEGFLCIYDGLPVEEFVSVKIVVKNPEGLLLATAGETAGTTGAFLEIEAKLTKALTEGGFTETLDDGTWAVAGDK